jgi:predicted dehydrogenase
MRQDLQTEGTGSGENFDLSVIGCGKHCIHSHLTKMIGNKAATLKGVYDPSRTAVADLSEVCLLPTSVFSSEEELLLSPTEAVLIMSPDDFHADSLVRAVRAGKHVFVEKPLAINSQQLESVVGALRSAAERNLIVSSCHPRRFDPPFIWMKQTLPQLVLKLGVVTHFEFDFSYHKPSKEWKHQRGLLLDHANHEIDLVHWYFGHQPFTAWKLADGAEHYHVCGVRDDSIHFSFNGSRKLDNRVYREFMKVRFERGTLTLDANLGKVVVHNHDTDEISSIEVQGIDYDRRFRLVNENFVQAVQSRAANYLTPEDLYVNTALGVHLTESETWRYDGKSIV